MAKASLVVLFCTQLLANAKKSILCATEGKCKFSIIVMQNMLRKHWNVGGKRGKKAFARSKRKSGLGAAEGKSG